ncbi:MAG: MaoC family dehydratase N-terminal domain-containing protein [Gemmatimonadota bacterium]|nr:MaoC family dehydratase N-terminal domain-containing protein [Gemmatimonadota bacterium]
MGNNLNGWIDRELVEHDFISLDRARLLATTLGRESTELADGEPLPPGWHLIYFNSAVAGSELSADGHAHRGSFLPPIPLPHRMWAGGSFHFLGPLKIGASVRRTSTIKSISEKQGRSGRLVFVTVRQLISQADTTVIDEEKVLVFRNASGSNGVDARPSPQLPKEPIWDEPFIADEVTLFRFSALTFNSHRIHYDHPYVTDVEGYPGLIVHGPLLALLIADNGVRRLGHRSPPAGLTFKYRSVQPLFCNESIRICGDAQQTPMRLWAAHKDRGVATEATLEFESG